MDAAEANNLGVSTSPPPGEPGRDTPSAGLPAAPVHRGDSTAGPSSAVMGRARRRWRTPAAPVQAALIAVVMTSGAMVAVGEGRSAEAVASASPVTPAPDLRPAAFGELPLPPTTATTLPAPDPAPRTRPAAPPVEERVRVPIVKIGEIRIPKIGLVHPIFEGVTLTVIDRGPGHWPGSAVPGQRGNAVFAGHRTTHSRPFRNVDKLAPGDEIIFVMPNGRFTYRMTKQQIVRPKDTWIVNPTQDATVTLFACHPPGSAARRIVIRGEFVARS